MKKRPEPEPELTAQPREALDPPTVVERCISCRRPQSIRNSGLQICGRCFGRS